MSFRVSEEPDSTCAGACIKETVQQKSSTSASFGSYFYNCLC